MSAQHTPGPWTVNYEAGALRPWGLHRTNPNFKAGLGRIEQLKAGDGSEARFWTELEARAAIPFVDALAIAKAQAGDGGTKS